jgi:hypothetical protein
MTPVMQRRTTLQPARYYIACLISLAHVDGQLFADAGLRIADAIGKTR